MKGLIFNVQHFCVHDGPGIRTTVFMKGCPLRCMWCFNPESHEFKPSFSWHRENCIGCQSCVSACPEGALSWQGEHVTLDENRCTWCGKCVTACDRKALKIYGREYDSRELLDELLQDRRFYETSGGGVTFSGGEVLSQSEFVAEMADLLREEGIHVLVETSGYGSRESLDRMAEKVDEIYYDLKFLDNDKHVKYTGKPNGIILTNLESLKDRDVRVTVRIPVIWGINDGDNIMKSADYVKNLGFVDRIGLLPYENIGVGKYADLGREYELHDLEVRKNDELEQYVSYIESLGLRVEIGI